MTSTSTIRELAHRRNDGLDIRLLWTRRPTRSPSRSTTRRPARASSSRSGRDERALDVFHHPFAYAAFRDAARKRSPQYA